jgi:hypothetical protein
MSFAVIANRMGVTSAAVEELISGRVPMAVASRLKITTASLQKFVDGGTSIGLARLLGCSSANLQDLRNAVGRRGAIGLLIGLCSQRPKD